MENCLSKFQMVEYCIVIKIFSKIFIDAIWINIISTTFNLKSHEHTLQAVVLVFHTYICTERKIKKSSYF